MTRIRQNLVKWLNRLALLVISVAGLVGVLGLFIFRPYSTDGSIPQGWGYSRVPSYLGHAATPTRISGSLPPPNPYLAITNSNNMHVDSFASDVHPRGGPLGVSPAVKSYAHGSLGGECASVTFDSNGNLVAVCATFKKFSLVLISRQTLRPIAQFDLPPRASNKTLNLRKIMSDTSGGAYFFLDHRDRAVLVDAEQHLRIIGQSRDGDKIELKEEMSIDLRPFLTAAGSQDSDVITAVLPDFSGILWFVSRGGVVGTVDLEGPEVHTLRLDGEEIQNSFAVDKHGAYIVSDKALYLISGAKSKSLTVLWREAYERSTHVKPGTLTLGSGTTPTLVGDSWVAITDNASPRINVLIYNRKPEHRFDRLRCKVPVFRKNKSATENTMIGFGNSVIVENNYGYDLFPTMMFGKRAAGGVSRIDVRDDDCIVRWQSSEVSQTTVPKLSAETGLVYLYTKEAAPWAIDAFYLTALDFDTGRTVFKKLSGTGVSYDNNWAPITLGPNRCAYIGVLRGLVQICDQPERID